MPRILDLMEYRARPGVSDESVERGAAEIDAWARRQDGFLGRMRCKRGDGRWFDALVWRDGPSAQAADAGFAARMLWGEIEAAEHIAPGSFTRRRVVLPGEPETLSADLLRMLGQSADPQDGPEEAA
ncbi:MAG: hypothetical protein VYD87_08725 [Pseudomonadota bacterium]|nr:hypothetical protein [Pseudomonadota bacterium]